ncbi:hypothetical protein [Nocardiopsis sp. SBT366]|uniref:hypothetical protein n=1 Tax=Nocardiopsis sp. SBT366 TaxID=1580529 RepID=UPI00066A7B25|nr:hypothetical protein [Nocardiopsis sp. SBT366]
MRKHHTRWVALFSAAAISTTGLVGLSGPAAANDADAPTLSWPVVRQGVSTYGIDGFEITYLPAGLERYGINATSTTDRVGNRQSQISWVQGPDQLYGRVAVLRSERLQDLEDLRESRYSHLSESSLEEVAPGGAFEHGAYLSEETGDLFWVERPGVAVATHLQPERWESAELVRLAEAVIEESAPQESGAEEPTAEDADVVAAEESAPAEDAADEVAEAAPAEPVEEAPTEEAPVEEALVEEVPVDQVPAEEAPAEEAPVDEEVVDGAELDELTPVEEAPVEQAPVQEEAPAEEAPATENTADEATPAQEGTAPQDQNLPENASSREVRTCLTGHFVDFGSGETQLDPARMTRTSGEFVERALSGADLGDAERDRLLATVWYYGHEDDKVAATNDCANQLGLERSEVEDAVAEVSGIIAELVREANESVSSSMDEVRRTSGEAAEVQPVTDPVGAEEWAELWDSLPWSIPVENS